MERQKLNLPKRRHRKGKNRPPWKVMVIDDEPQIHSMSKIVFKEFEFKGRGVKMISAYSRIQAERLLPEHPDLALILLDVVMEENDSGLRLIKFIREQLNNRLVRIILRTGQPGQAPEKTVTLHYSINDYRLKPELTVERLFSSVVAALRSYQELVELKRKGDQERERVELLKSKVAEVRKVLLESSGQSPSSATPDMSIPEDERIKKISAFVASHLGEFFQQSEAATILKMSASQFSKYFKQTTGITFINFVNRSRIDQACTLLVETDSKVPKIAKDVGFRSLSNFNKRFKEIKKMSPRKFRIKTRQEINRKKIICNLA
jgi:AraC-like DNA-binding protein/CheY-like chemotaxis protein